MVMNPDLTDGASQKDYHPYGLLGAGPPQVRLAAAK
jgi:hypothetical protein